MRRTWRLVPGLFLALAATACEEGLVVENLNSPDVDRVFATPASIEGTIASGYQACHNATAQNSVNTQLLTLSLESYSSLNNFFMGPRGTIPRSPIVNTNGTDAVPFNDFSRLSRAGRLAANAINALDNLDSLPLSGRLGSFGQDRRARAFAHMTLACNQAVLALLWDSAGVVVPGMPSDEVPPLSGHADVMAAAIRMLDTAEAIASSAAATAAGGFPDIPATWLSQGANVSRANFIRVVRSLRARFRAGVARTPTERAAVDWNAVIADAENGITSNLMVSAGGSTGWNIGFIGSQMHVEPTWSQISYMYFGMADTTGRYDTWLATPMNDRTPFLLQTPDRRWPAGATRAAQRTNSPANPGSATNYPYIQNRTVEDAPGDGWGWSYYDYYRYKYIRLASNQGPWPEIMKAEIDLLAAEGYIRTGNIAAAAAKIDISRTAAGLPALSGVITTAAQLIPGAGCVPRVPVDADGPTQCGTIMEAMKYEKRMETAYSGFGQWFFDSRGWGDLVEKTPLEYPVPYQELDARQKPYYALGGGGNSSAAKGTYGY